MSFLRADESLTEQQKAEKRQEMSEAAQANAALAAQQKTPAAPANPWTVNVVTNYGYDRNVTFDANREADTFHQETVTGTYKTKHDDILFIPAGKYGIAGNIDQLDYHRRNESNYRNFKINPFFSSDLTNTTSLKTEYTFKSTRYLKNDSIGYLSHEIKHSLSESRFSHWLHTLYTSVELKDYTKKLAFDWTGAFSDDKRLDVLSEYGYSAVYFPSEKLVFGVTGAYKINDSNDNFKNFSDFDGYKVTGFIYAAFNDRLSWVGAAGYDHKWYGSKTLTEDASKKEWDGFLYFASYLYYNLTPKTQIVLSYLWDQNFSDDPTLQFTGSMVTAGVSVKI